VVKLIVGLGNPGIRYARTRHNVGFDTVEIFARRQGWGWGTHRGKTRVATGMLGSEKIVLAQPQTYMNESGIAVAELVRFYKLAPGDLLVICDDLDLPLGKVRLRTTGGAGGQHGMESIIRHLGSNQFARIRVGVGRPMQGRDDNVDFLLSRPSGDERIALDSAIERAAEAARMWAEQGAEAAMNAYNA
jgi:PTH1 family peptidyl-tRNA hydrolase